MPGFGAIGQTPISTLPDEVQVPEGVSAIAYAIVDVPETLSQTNTLSNTLTTAEIPKTLDKAIV